MIKWFLDKKENKLKMFFKNKEFFWVVPEDYKMPSSELLNLVEWLLFTPFGINIPLKQKRKNAGKKLALAYSGGEDSHSVLAFFDDIIPIHNNVAFPKGLHKTINGVMATRNIGGYVVNSNVNELPKLFGMSVGFHKLGGFAIPAILLAEYLQIKTIFTGDILDAIYSDYKTYFLKKNEHRVEETIKRFKHAGLDLGFPLAGLTEVSTTKIVTNFLKTENKNVTPCMRGDNGKSCNNCYKCYRKSILKGLELPMNKETEKIFSKDYIYVLPALLWGMKKYDIGDGKIKNISKDITWVDKWYSPSIKFIPEYLREDFLKKINKFKIEHIKNISLLEGWNSYIK